MIKGQVDAAISAGQSIAGKKFAPLKSGGQALQGAQHDITVTASGRSIKISIKDGLVYSEFGTSHQVARPVLDWGNSQIKLGSAIAKGLVTMGEEWLNRPGSHKTWK